MSSRARSIGAELAESERQTEELNASLERSAQRERLAITIAVERYASDDVDVPEEDGKLEYVDGGYWVKARVFVDADTVEERMPSEGTPTPQ